MSLSIIFLSLCFKSWWDCLKLQHFSDCWDHRFESIEHCTSRYLLISLFPLHIQGLNSIWHHKHNFLPLFHHPHSEKRLPPFYPRGFLSEILYHSTLQLAAARDKSSVHIQQALNPSSAQVFEVSCCLTQDFPFRIQLKDAKCNFF